MRTLKTIRTIQPPTPTPHLTSPWKSPVPYLFGGLAAMLGLITFALLILACSHWRTSGQFDSDNEDDVESGNEKEGSSEKLDSEKVYEEKILVIMAGEDKPTFLATIMSSKSSLFSEENQKVESNEGDNKAKLCDDDKGNVESHGSLETTLENIEENHETTHQE